MIKRLKSEKGSALIMVVTVMVVISILGIGLITLSSSEQKQTIEEVKNLQATYNANSGAQIMGAFVNENPSVFNQKIGDQFDAGVASKPFPFSVNLDKGSFDVNVTLEEDKAVMTITGHYLDAEEAINLNLDLVDTTPEFLFPKYLTTTSELPNYEALVLPDDLTSRSPLYVHTDTEYTLSSDTTYDISSITVDSGEELSFVTNGGDCQVIVNQLTINGYFNLKDNGRLILFVKDKATINSRFLNANENLVIMLAENADLTIDANGDFNAYIYGPKASIKIMNGTKVIGAVIAGHYNYTGSSDPGVYVVPTKVMKLKDYIKYQESYYYEKGNTKQ